MDHPVHPGLQFCVPVAVRVSLSPQTLVLVCVNVSFLHLALVPGLQGVAEPQHLAPVALRLSVLLPGQTVLDCVKLVPRHRLPVDGDQAVAVQGVTSGGGGGVTGGGGGVTGGGGGTLSLEHVPDVFVPVVERDERGLPGGVPVQPLGTLETLLVCVKRVPEQRLDRDGDQVPADHEVHVMGSGV